MTSADWDRQNGGILPSFSPTQMRSESTEAARAAEAARQAGIAKSSNVSGYGGYKTDAAIAEAARRDADARATDRSADPSTSGGHTNTNTPNNVNAPGYFSSSPNPSPSTGALRDNQDAIGYGSWTAPAAPPQYSPDPSYLGGLPVNNIAPPASTALGVFPAYTPLTPTMPYAVAVVAKPVARARPRPVPVALVRVAPPPIFAPALIYVPGMGYTKDSAPIDKVGAVAQQALADGLSPAAARAKALAYAAQNKWNVYDPNLNKRVDNVIGAGGKSDHTNNAGPSGAGSNSYHGVTTVGDHWGHDSGVKGDKDNGWNGHPVLLDLEGNGLSIKPLTSSSQFIDLEGNGYQHRTAWAGAGNGVLVLDADGDGKISRSSEFVFTEWDQTAESDLDALKSVFDTNHNGLLDAGDDRWSEFKVMVNGQLVSLASLGIASIGLTATGSGQNFADGSAITGTATYTKTDGTTGAVGDAVLASDVNGYIIKTTAVTNGDGSKTTTLGGYDKDGTLAFQNRITVSADGLSTTTQFDDDGNGTYERSQTDILAYQPAPPPTPYTPPAQPSDIVGTAGADHLVGTAGNDVIRGGSGNDTFYGRDGNDFLIGGDGAYNQADYDGSAADYTITRNADGSITVASAAGVDTLVRIHGFWFADEGPGGHWYSAEDLAPSRAGQQRSRTIANFAADGSLTNRTVVTTSADLRTVTTSLDLDGDGVNDEVQVYVRNTDGSSTTTTSKFSANGTLLRKIATTASADGLTKTVQSDTTGCGVYDLVTTETTVVAGDGTRTKTVAETSSGGTLIDREQTVTSADGRTRTVSHDLDGNGTYETRDVTAISNGINGGSVTTVSTYSSTNVLIGKTVATTSVDGLTKAVEADLNGDGQYDRVSSDVTVVGVGGSLSQTQQVKSRDGTLLSTSTTDTSADRKTISISTDANGDGHVDTLKAIVIDGAGVTTSTVSQHNSDGSLVGKTFDQTSADGLSLTSKVDIDSDGIYDTVVTDVTTTDASSNRTRTITTKSANGTLIGSFAVTTSADSLTQTRKDDNNADGTVDRTTVTATVLAGDGSRTVTATTTSTSGAMLAKTEVKTSADRQTTTTKVDANGDTKVDRTQVDVVNADGSQVSTVSDTDFNGALHGRTETSISGDGLTKTVKQDVNGDGIYDTTTQAVTAIAASGTRTTTTSTTSSNGTLLARTIAAVSANGLSIDAQIDADGNGVVESKSSDVTVLNADGSKTRTVSELGGTGTLIGKTTTVTSANGQVVTASIDLDGDGLVDIVSSDVKLLGSGGVLTETRQTKSRDGSLLSSSTTNTSADRKTTSISTDADGDGRVDTVKTIVVDAAGVTTSTVNTYNPDGSLAGRTFDQAWANGLSLTSKADIDGDGVYDAVVTDVTTIDASSNRTRTVTTKSANGTLIGSSAVITSANGLIQTRKDDINADGTVDRTTVTATVLGADGSRTVTSTTTSTSGAMLARTEVTTSADQKTTTTRIDSNGDTKIDQTQIDVLNADGSHTTTVSDTDSNGVQHAKSETTVSADGLTVTDKQDVNGDGVYDAITQAATVIAASGSRTKTTSTTSNNGTLLSRTIATVTGNGLSADIQVDANGDGTVERKSSDVTILNADGSTTRTVSAFAGTGALIGKTITTTSANGLTSTVQADLDGNGTIDRTSTATTTRGADGSKTDIVSVKNGNNAQIARFQTITSGDGNTVTAARDLDGDGSNDETTSAVLNADGSTTTVNRTYASGALTSSASRTVSANGLSSTLAIDLDGNGTIDRSTTDVIVLNADGSKTETITDFWGVDLVRDKTVVVTSANGLTKTATWAAAGTTTSRSKVDTTVLNADGSTTETVDYKNVNGSLESRTVTTVSANKLTTTVTKDVNGDGLVDLTTTTVTGADGSVTTTTTGPDTTANALGTGAYTTAPSTTSKTTTISADGLSSTTLYGSTSVDYLPLLHDKRTTETTVGADGSTIQTIKAYQLGVPPSGQLVLSEQTRTTTSGNGLSTTKEWDLNGDGLYDRKETDVTVLNADGSKVHTVNKFEGASQTSSFVTTTSANGLSLTTSLNLFGANPFSQHSTDVMAVNADGSTTRTVTSYKADGSQLSKFITTTSADGRTVTTQEDIDGAVGIDRVTVDDTRKLADGSVVETIKRSTPSGTLLDSTVKTTSGDGRLISIYRDADGDGTRDQYEVTTKAVDGSVSAVIVDLSAANHQSSTTQLSTSADGLSRRTAWDFDGDGTVEQIRWIDVANLGNGITDTKTRHVFWPSYTFINKTTTYASDDGRNSWTGVDYDAAAGGFDNLHSTIVAADGSKVDGFYNRRRDAAFLVPGVVYWKNAIAANIVQLTSSDGLTETTFYDYDGNGANPVSNPNPNTSNFEVTAVSQAQIDGSVVTSITEKNGLGTIVAKGTITASADGMTTTLLKDADNNGTYEHKEVAVTRIDGSIRKVVTDYNASGAVTQTVTTDVSADGQSTSTVTANATTGTGTATGIGVEFIATGATNDTITGSAGDDHIQGGAGVDTLNGGAGDDLLDGGTGADIMKGNAGNDTYIVDDAGDQVVELAAEGTDTVLSSVTYTISDPDVENLTLTGTAAIDGTGNASANVLTGNSAANRLDGGAGNDTLYGGAGNDILLGGSGGNDTLVGGLGNDYQNGQDGDDTYIFQRGDGSDTVEDFVMAGTAATADINAAQALGVSASGIVNTWVGGYIWLTSTNSLYKLTASGTDTLVLTGGITADNLSFAWTGVHSDNLVISIAGGPAGDSVTLDQQATTVARVDNLKLDGLGPMRLVVVNPSGQAVPTYNASNIVFGLSGNDYLYGGSLSDVIYGGAGDDTISGQGGGDVLVGGKGNDTVSVLGFLSNDKYVFHQGDGIDLVADYYFAATTSSSDIAAANALGVKAGGITNTWVGGFQWQTSSNSLLKISDGGVDTLSLEGGTKADDLSFSWTGVHSDDLVINIGSAGDRVTIQNYAVAGGKIEQLALDGLGAMNLTVATSIGATVNAGTGSNLVFGLTGNETLWGNTGDDIIYGGAGNDVLSAGTGDDTLVGGLGNDYQNGEGGSDRYVFRRGDGSDTIQDFSMVITTAAADINAAQSLGVSATGTVNTWIGGYYWQTASNSLLKLIDGTGTDTLSLEGGIKVDDLSFSWTGTASENLLLSINGGPAGDAIRMDEQTVAVAKIEKLALEGIGALNLAVARSAGATVSGSADADIIFGLTGNETLNGNAGNDILIGGAGNDTLVGGAGNDQYRFRAGDGSDTIVESGSYTDNDELDFGTGIDANELWFAQQGNNLVISVLGTTDKVMVNGWFAGPGNVVETIKSGDGKLLSHSDVATLVAAMAGFDPATSPTGSGIQPNDPRLGDPSQIGTVAAAMQQTWMAA